MAEEKKKEKTLREKLLAIQSELKAPKKRRNTFANFDYRNCEDILEAVKPLLKKEGVTLLLTDHIDFIGDRFYVKATAQIDDGTGEIATIAYAREQEAKKGMDTAQVTGSSSSYARKRALEGLLLIDSERDPDGQKQNGNEKPIDKTLDIVEQAFFNFTTEYKDDLAEGFVYDKDKFTKAIVKHFKRLPTKEKSIPEIVAKIKPAEVIKEIKEEDG
jgi:hypothetical protein